MTTIAKPLLLDETYKEGNAALIHILENITTATDKANEAAASAEDATTKADIATTKASEAIKSADSASTSASSAINASSVAVQSLRDAQLIANSGNADLLSTQNAADIIDLDNKVNKLESAYNVMDIINELAVNQCVDVTNGEIISNSNYISTQKIPVYKGWVLNYSGLRANTSYTAIAFYDSNNQYVSELSVAGTSLSITGEYSVVQNGYIILTVLSSYLDYVEVLTLTSNIAKKLEPLSAIYKLCEDITLIDLISLLKNNDVAKANGGILYDNGTAVASTNISSTDYFKVFKGSKIQWRNIRNQTSIATLAFYDNDRNYIKEKSIVGLGVVNNGTWIAEDSGFIKISCRNYEVIGSTVQAVCLLYPPNADMIINTVGTDYMQSGVNRILTQLNSLTDKVLTVFGFSTDQHLTGDNDIPSTLRGLRAMSLLTHKYPFDFVALGGDSCSSATVSNNEIISMCAKVQEPLYDAKCSVVPIIGNHEAFTSVIGTMSSSALFNQCFKHIVNDKKITALNNKSTNGYYDSTLHKIRFIFFDDSVDVSKRPDYTSANRLEAMQIMLQGTPDDYNIVIISHRPLIREQATVESFQTAGVEFSSVLTPYSDKIICCISGHVHEDVSDNGDGILHIATTLAYSVQDINGNTRPLGKEEETAFDVFAIDQENRKIYALRYGFGNNREWSY